MGRRTSLRTARKVLNNARQALLPPPEVAALYRDAITQAWQRYQQREASQEQLVAEGQPGVSRQCSSHAGHSAVKPDRETGTGGKIEQRQGARQAVPAPAGLP